MNIQLLKLPHYLNRFSKTVFFAISCLENIFLNVSGVKLFKTFPISSCINKLNIHLCHDQARLADLLPLSQIWTVVIKLMEGVIKILSILINMECVCRRSR